MIYPPRPRAAVAFHVPFPLPGPLPRQHNFFSLTGSFYRAQAINFFLVIFLPDPFSRAATLRNRLQA